MIRRPPRSTQGVSSAASDVYKRQAQNIKGSGDAQANELYAKAFSKDPEFAKFYRSLDAYRQSFNKPQDMMVVDPSSEFFDYLKSSRGEVQANKQP